MKNDAVIGAIVGDVVGSRFEHHNLKSKDFELFSKDCRFTDDTVMTLAIAKGLLELEWHKDLYIDNDFAHDVFMMDFIAGTMKEFGRHYKHRGYGGAFKRWIYDNAVVPNYSWGNGAAMRISPVACVSYSEEDCKRYSELITSVSHLHKEAIKGAEAVAISVYKAKNKCSLESIKTFICDNYYDIDFSLDNIRESYKFDVSCQGSVPQALQCFFESASFEDAIRNAVSIGGDSDTIGAITGAIAGAYYGVPNNIRNEAKTYLSKHLIKTLDLFEERFCSDSYHGSIQGR